MTEIWNFLIAVLLYGSFCFCSNTIHYVSVSDFESNNSRITYETATRNSYCEVSFTYPMSCDTGSPRPRFGLVVRLNSQLEQEMHQYQEPTHSTKSHTGRRDWKGTEALSRAMGQPSTVLPVDPPGQTTCSGGQFGKKVPSLPH